MNYEGKYLKYKRKYLDLKQHGGLFNNYIITFNLDYSNISYVSFLNMERKFKVAIENVIKESDGNYDKLLTNLKNNPFFSTELKGFFETKIIHDDKFTEGRLKEYDLYRDNYIRSNPTLKKYIFHVFAFRSVFSKDVFEPYNLNWEIIYFSN